MSHLKLDFTTETESFLWTHPATASSPMARPTTPAGCRLLFPPAPGADGICPRWRYRTASLFMKSCTTLYLEKGAVLLGDNDRTHYPILPGVIPSENEVDEYYLTGWEGNPLNSFAGLLNITQVHDVVVTGEGTLDCDAQNGDWWIDPKVKRIAWRPRAVAMVDSENICLHGITVQNSYSWTIHPIFVKHLDLLNFNINNPYNAPNTDGIDPESCEYTRIIGVNIHVGDDCIAMKASKVFLGMKLKKSCEHTVIRNCLLDKGHGGIVIGSEMSGGIYNVLACGNRFSSPNLTYALRLKTNARRGGAVEHIMLCDSVMEHVHGAAIHGTMLYEDGRNGDSLPVFRDITIENITAHGGDYGIFLEAFPEVPITGLVLRNITIDGVYQCLRSMNWQDAVVENVTINGKRFPRPDRVRVLGVPCAGGTVAAAAECCGASEPLRFHWRCSPDGVAWRSCGEGETLILPSDARLVQVEALDPAGESALSCCYKVLQQSVESPAARLCCRGMLNKVELDGSAKPVTRQELAWMLFPLANQSLTLPVLPDTDDPAARYAAANAFLALKEGRFVPQGTITRQEMATVAMQACGVNYRNASSTMPVCADAARVADNYGTNAARALYFGFMELDENGCFGPDKLVSRAEAVEILNRVADFAGL